MKVYTELLSYLAALAQEMRRDGRLELGPSPRAMVHLLHCSQSKAALDGRDFVTPDDVKARADVVLSHRLRLGRAAVVKGLATSPSQVVLEILQRVEPPR